MNKKIFDQILTYKKLRKLIVDTAKQFGVSRVCFNNRGVHVRGTYNCISKVLYLDLKQDKKELLNTFFHELGHHQAVKNKKWLKYHEESLSAMTADKIFYVENKIDGIAKKLWNKYVDIKTWGRYKYFYPKIQKNIIMKTLFAK